VRSARSNGQVRRRRCAAPLLLLAAVAAASSACATRAARQTVFDHDDTRVVLRSQKKGGEVVDKGFDHPVSIEPARIAHILSRVDVRHEEGRDAALAPAIPSETLYLIADGIAEGLAKADSSQEVVVQSIRRGTHWGIFGRRYLTGLLCYRKGDLLYLHISSSDGEIPNEVEEQDEERLPEPRVGRYPLDFRLVVDRGMALVDRQAVAVDWRDPIFDRPTRTRMLEGGRVVRRTILMESLEDETDPGPRRGLSEDPSPEQLRALAELGESRRRGEITESEYIAERNRVLRGGAP
jgi:hypothetical protein